MKKFVNVLKEVVKWVSIVSTLVETLIDNLKPHEEEESPEETHS